MIIFMKKFIFILSVFVAMFSCHDKTERGIMMTVKGPVSPDSIGITLTHEHVLVDFVGADSISSDRWKRADVIEIALPFLNEIRAMGFQTFVECTPAFLGRDPQLLKNLSDLSGLNIITNTGYYGVRNNKFIPGYAFTESADQLARRWIDEWENGIEGTGIKPGFIKIGVDNGNLSDMHRTLITAAARTHLATGLVIASHTGPAIPAFEQIEILREEGVSPQAFIWVHAQNEKNFERHTEAARLGAWISFDGLRTEKVQDYVRMIRNMKENDMLDHVLLSHDAGWYDPAKPNGGEFRGYSTLFTVLLPILKKENFTDDEINRLLVINPGNAFEIKVKRIQGVEK
jgi:phosphotriesterase-related protein